MQVDTHAHQSTCMHLKLLLRFIKSILKSLRPTSHP